jgi:hypothetical protein
LGKGGVGLGDLNGSDLVFADQRDAVVGLDPKHVLFVADDGSDNFLPIFQDNLFRESGTTCAKERPHDPQSCDDAH